MNDDDKVSYGEWLKSVSDWELWHQKVMADRFLCMHGSNESVNRFVEDKLVLIMKEQERRFGEGD